MKKRYLPQWWPGAAFICCLLWSPLWIMAQGFSPQTEARLQQLLDSIQTSASNPVVGGMSVAINVDGLALWQGVTGYAARNVDGQNNLVEGGIPMTRETISQMYSVTKTFTAPLVLELAREGWLSLDDPVIKYIPFLPAINAGLDGTVTIRQLLAHQSGWSDYTAEEMTILMITAQPNEVYTPYHILGVVHQIAPKGSVTSYSSTNYTTLGAIIENITQKPVEQHYRERFFTPLKLNSMYMSIREPNPVDKTLAAPHDNFYPFNPIWESMGSPLRFPPYWTNVSALPYTGILSLAFTGGGLVTNAADMARWGNDLFGGRATSQATLDSMINSIPSTPDATGDYMGYGIWVNDRISETDLFIGHNGRAPGYRSVMMYQPDRKMTISILTNFSGLDTRMGGLDPYDIAHVLYEALPNFIGGNENRKEAKIRLCFQGKTIMVDRSAAAGFIQKGAYLGSCAPAPMLTALKNATPGQALLVYPNPVQGRATISYTADTRGPVHVALFDLSGKQVTTLFNGQMDKGEMRNLTLQAGGISAGTYFCRVKSNSGVKQQKVVLMW